MRITLAWTLAALCVAGLAAQTTGFGPQQVVTTAVNEPNSVCAFDLDGDGDLDAQARARFDGEVLMGRDLMQVEFDAAR